MYRCVHCGLCLSSCPTYAVTGLETESPRGRIALMKAVNEGRLEITPRVVSHWDACLQCRACEAVCPSGVPYGRIMENTRSQVLDRSKQLPATAESAACSFGRHCHTKDVYALVCGRSGRTSVPGYKGWCEGPVACACCPAT